MASAGTQLEAFAPIYRDFIAWAVGSSDRGGLWLEI
jgi:hypothetical protein